MQKPIYSVPIKNKDKKDNETYIFRHPEALGLDLNSLPNETLHFYYKKFLEKPNEPFMGERRITPYGNLDKCYHFYTR